MKFGVNKNLWTELCLVRSWWCWVPMNNSLCWVCLVANRRSYTRYVRCVFFLVRTSVPTSSSSKLLIMPDSSFSSHTTGTYRWICFLFSVFASLKILCLHPFLYLFLVGWAWWDCPLTWLTNHRPSVMWYCWLGHLTNVSSGTLNSTIPIPI